MVHFILRILISYFDNFPSFFKKCNQRDDDDEEKGGKEGEGDNNDSGDDDGDDDGVIIDAFISAFHLSNPTLFRITVIMLRCEAARYAADASFSR